MSGPLSVSNTNNINLSPKEARELGTFFFNDIKDTVYFVPTRNQHLYITELQEEVQENMRKYL